MSDNHASEQSEDQQSTYNDQTIESDQQDVQAAAEDSTAQQSEAKEEKQGAEEKEHTTDTAEKREAPRRYRYFVENQLKQKSSTYVSKVLDSAESCVDKMTTVLGDINPFLSLERLRDDRMELRPFIYMFNFLIYMLAALNAKHIYHAIMCLLFMYPTAGGFLTVMSLLSEDAERAANIGRRAAFLILSVGIDYTVKLFSFTRRNLSRGFRPVRNKSSPQY